MAGIKGKSGGRRVGAGRPGFKPTDEQRILVEKLAAFGVRLDEMHIFVAQDDGKPVSASTLRKHFKNEIAQGRIKANYKVANALYRNAVDEGSISAQIFWLKTQGGWKAAPQAHELTGTGGAPIEQRTTLIDEAQIKAALARLERDY